MARPSTTLTLQYLTTGDVARELNIDRYRVKQWIDRGILPQPTYRDEQGTRCFDHNWLTAAKAIIGRMNKEITFDELLEVLGKTGVDHEFVLSEELTNE